MCKTIKSLISSSDAIEDVINVEKNDFVWDSASLPRYLLIDLMVTEAWVKGQL